MKKQLLLLGVTIALLASHTRAQIGLSLEGETYFHTHELTSEFLVGFSNTGEGWGKQAEAGVEMESEKISESPHLSYSIPVFLGARNIMVFGHEHTLRNMFEIGGYVENVHGCIKSNWALKWEIAYEYEKFETEVSIIPFFPFDEWRIIGEAAWKPTERFSIGGLYRHYGEGMAGLRIGTNFFDEKLGIKTGYLWNLNNHAEKEAISPGWFFIGLQFKNATQI